MIRLIYSNRTERLLAQLSVDLRKGDPLEPARLVVPNRNIETFLRFGLARLNGIAANLEVRFLGDFLLETARAGGERLEPVSGRTLQGLILSILLDADRLVRPDLAPVCRYLHAVDGSAESIDLRRFQLAGQLARLFEEYAYARPEMLDAWPTGTTLPGAAAEVESWQRALWLEVFGPGGILSGREREDERRRLMLPALFQSLRRDELKLPERVFLFGISYVARAFQAVLARLGEATELRIYTLNPCMEFWEDVPDGLKGIREDWARRHQRRGEELFEQEDPFGLESERDTPALRLWGRPGRENVRLLDALTGCESEHLFAEPVEKTLLQRLQADILLRRPEPATPPTENRFVEDKSLQLLACPGIRRECEEVSREIWRIVEEDGERARDEQRAPLRFNDIAVIVGGRDREAYFDHLSAAFRESWNIPHTLGDLPFAATSRVADAAQALFALPLGRFTRAELAGVMTHPVVTARVPAADPAQWLAWCDALGIVHGADHSDHAETYIDRDVLNWDQGVRRLVLGTFLPGGRTGAARPLTLGGEDYLPHEVSQSSQSDAARFGLLARSLIADARFARDARLRLEEWTTFFLAFAESYLAAGTEEDERDLARLRGAIARAGETDVDGRAVSYVVALELVKQEVEKLSRSRGHPLADGVVVTTARPMRAIPFRVVFMVGLGEGDFPSPMRRNELDLRLARPRPGDVTDRQQDRYLFLETLLCARDRLYLSFVARDPLTGDSLEPSSVVAELRHILERGYLGREGAARWARTAPLRRFDPDCFADGAGDNDTRPRLPEARAERAARRLREDLLAATGGKLLPERDKLLERLTPAVRETLSPRLGLASLPPHVPKQEDTGPVHLSVSALRRFLECPLQGYARHVLRLDGETEEDLLEVTDEPFATDRLLESQVLSQSFLEVLRDPPPGEMAEALEAACDWRANLEALCGRMPVGVFGEVEARRHHGTLDRWLEALGAGGDLPRLAARRFGAAAQDERIDEPLPPVSLGPISVGGREREVLLVGSVGPLIDSPSATVILERRRLYADWTEPVRRWRKALRAFLDQALLTASGQLTGPHRALILVDTGASGMALPVDLAPLSCEEAVGWLRTLATDLLSAPHDYRLPCEAVLRRHADGCDLEATIEELFQPRPKLGPTSLYGPLARPERYEVLSPEENEVIVRRRFGPFLHRLDKNREAR